MLNPERRELYFIFPYNTHPIKILVLNPERRELYFIFPYNTHPIKILNLGCFYFLHVSKIAHFFSFTPTPSSKQTSFFTSDSLVASYWSPCIHSCPHLNYHPISSWFPALPRNHWVALALRIKEKFPRMNDRVLPNTVSNRHPDFSPFFHAPCMHSFMYSRACFKIFTHDLPSTFPCPLFI